MLIRRNLKKVACLLTTIFILCMSIGVGATAQEKITLTWLSHIYKPWNDILTKQAREYEKLYPDVKIIYSTVLHADLNTKILVSIAGGTWADMTGIYGPWMKQFHIGGWIAPAPSFVEEDIEKNTVRIARTSATYADKIYAYVQHLGIPTPIINLDLYEKAGVEPPTTYDELFEVNKKLDKYDKKGRLVQAGTTLATTIAGSWNVIHWSGILLAYGGEVISKDGKKAVFNTPAGVEATRAYAKLAHPKFIPDAFVLGKSAMEWNGPWTRSFYEINAPKLRYKALPSLKAKERVTSGYVWFWVVNNTISDRKKKEAWKFLQYISNDEKYLETCLKIGFITFRKENFENPAYKEDKWIQTFKKTLDLSRLYYSKEITENEKVDIVIGRRLERLLAGEITVEQALERAESEVNKILGE